MSDNRKKKDGWEGLKQDKRNANKGTRRGKQMVAQSIKELGAGRSAVAAKDGTFLAGNKSAEAAKSQGLPVRVVDTEGDEFVVVRRQDIPTGDHPKARKLAYADNRTSEISLEWDTDQVKEDWRAGVIGDGTLFKPEELEDITGEWIETTEAVTAEYTGEYGGDGEDGAGPSKPGVSRDERNYIVSFDLTFDESLIVSQAMREAERTDGITKDQWLLYMASVYLRGEDLEEGEEVVAEG